MESEESEESGGILSAAYLAGFPPADLFGGGPAVVVHGFDAAGVRAAADLLVHDIAVREPEFAEPLYEPAAAVRKALDICTSDDYRGQPVVIADTQDNPGAGGSGDTTGMLEALVAEGAAGAVLGVLCDPQAAQAAHHAGVGATIDSGAWRQGPDPARATVRGTFRGQRPRQRAIHRQCTRRRRAANGHGLLRPAHGEWRGRGGLQQAYPARASAAGSHIWASTRPHATSSW